MQYNREVDCNFIQAASSNVTPEKQSKSKYIDEVCRSRILVSWYLLLIIV